MENRIPPIEENPVQQLLAFAEDMWGSQFDDEGKPRWWCDDSINPNYLIVTNGQEYFASSDHTDGFIKFDVRGSDREIVAVSVTPIWSKEDVKSAYMQVLWN